MRDLTLRSIVSFLLKMMQKVEGIEKRRLWFVVRHNGGQNEVYCIQNPSILYIRSHNFENSNIHQTRWNFLAGVFPHKHYDHCCHLYDEMSMPASHHSFLAKDIRFQIFEFINTDNNISCRRKDTFPSGTCTKLCSSQNRSIFMTFRLVTHQPCCIHILYSMEIDLAFAARQRSSCSEEHLLPALLERLTLCQVACIPTFASGK